MLNEHALQKRARGGAVDKAGIPNHGFFKIQEDVSFGIGITIDAALELKFKWNSPKL